MHSLYTATPRPRDRHETSAAFDRAVKAHSLPQMITHAIASNPNINADKAKLARELLEEVYEFAKANRLVFTLAAMRLLLEIREAGPDKLKTRNDGNSSYTHEAAQCHYLIWTFEMRDPVVGRVAKLRTGQSSLADVAPSYLHDLRAQLDVELQPALVDARMAVTLLHDVIEDYGVSLGITRDVIEQKIADYARVAIDSQDVLKIGRGCDAISRRKMSDGQNEPMQLYINRLTDDEVAIEDKARDILHNNATIFLSGKNGESIEKKLKERELFTRQVQHKYPGRFVLLDYQCAYIKDQIGLIRRAMHTDPHDGGDCQLLRAHVNDIALKYRGTWLVNEIHPMMEIVGRIRRALDVIEAVNNQSGPETTLAAAPSAQPVFDPARPKPGLGG